MEELPLLISLQLKDQEIDGIEKKAAVINAQVVKKKGQMDQLKAALKESKEKLGGHQVKKKDLELEVEDKEKQVKKHQGELNSLKSNDAYKTMLSEIESSKVAQRLAEDNLLVLMETIEAADRDYKNIEKKIKQDEDQMKNEIRSLEQEAEGFLSQSKAKKDERNKFAESIPPSALNAYEGIRTRKGGVAVVPINGSSCGGCKMSLPPSKIMEVKKGRNMVLCESCSRILFIHAAPAAEVTPAPVTAAATPEPPTV